MDVINQVALHINNNNIEPLRKQNLNLNSLRPIPPHLIRKLDVDDLGTALIPGLAEEAEQCLFAAR